MFIMVSLISESMKILANLKKTYENNEVTESISVAVLFISRSRLKRDEKAFLEARWISWNVAFDLKVHCTS